MNTINNSLSNYLNFEYYYDCFYFESQMKYPHLIQYLQQKVQQQLRLFLMAYKLVNTQPRAFIFNIQFLHNM